MLKRMLAIFLLAALLIPVAAPAEGVKATLNQKMSTRSGPGTKYTEELGTLPQSTAITVTAQIETNGTLWYQVEYANNGRLYRAYTGAKRVNVSNASAIPKEVEVYEEDTTLEYYKPLYGPGTQYAERRAGVQAGTKVRVFGTEGEYALIEYQESGKWARGYIPVSALQNTEAAEVTPSPEPTETPEPTAAPTPRTAFNIIDADAQICIDYYGNEYSYAGHDEEFALLVGMLPVMRYFDGVPCVRSHTYVYSGPGFQYWRRWTGKDYAYTGLLDTNLRIYGEENGWIMIRYPSDRNGGYRYGWTIPEAISVENQSRVEPVEFAYLTGLTTRYVDATDDPDRSIQYGGTSVSDVIQVTMLAFLNEDRKWVYCEYSYIENGVTWDQARGFLPADGLRVK